MVESEPDAAGPEAAQTKLFPIESAAQYALQHIQHILLATDGLHVPGHQECRGHGTGSISSASGAMGYMLG